MTLDPDTGDLYVSSVRSMNVGSGLGWPYGWAAAAAAAGGAVDPAAGVAAGAAAGPRLSSLPSGRAAAAALPARG